MAMTRVPAKPTFSITLIFLILGVVAFLLLSIPSIRDLHAQGDTAAVTTIIVPILSLFTGVGFEVYKQTQTINQQAQTINKQTQTISVADNSLEAVGLQVTYNNVIFLINNKEVALRLKGELAPDANLPISQLSDSDILKTIPPQLEGKTDFLISEIRKSAATIDFHREIAQRLGENSKNLRRLSVKASNSILNELDPKRLESLGLVENSSRSDFYMDIYVYLKGWLRLSIEHGRSMPVAEVSQSQPDRKLYIDALRWIRDNGINDFGLADEEQQKVILDYLSKLIETLMYS